MLYKGKELEKRKEQVKKQTELKLDEEVKVLQSYRRGILDHFLFVNIGKPTREMPNNLLIPTEESKSYRPDDKTVGSKDDSMPPSDTLDQTKDTPVDNMDLEEAKESDGFSAWVIEKEPQPAQATSSKYPILFVDINLGHNRIERITIFEGDDPDIISMSQKYCFYKD